MSDFTTGRNNPLENVSSAELNTLFSSVASAFDISWLTEPSGSNRIQKLWSRQDGLATNQIAILGDALTRLTPLNPGWVIQRVNSIKAESAENRKGDLFELLGLSLFAVNGQMVTGAAKGKPGYDGTIEFSSGASALISLKDFGTSSHRKVFERAAAQVEQEIIAALHELRASGLGIKISASRYPLQADWEKLRRSIRNVVSGWLADPQPRQIGTNWAITRQTLLADGAGFADGHCSYSVMMLAPFHPNEQSNIESKIEDACTNLSRKARTSGAATARLLLIRIPETASPAACTACVEQWLRGRPQSGVDGVILYQPSVAAPSTTAPSGIVHFIGLVTGPDFLRWRPAIGLIQARVFIGLCTNKPTKLFGPDGSTFDDQYVYQRGQIYTRAEAKADGSIVGTMSNPAPGILTHTVLRIPGQPGECIISGKFPPDSDLSLYS